MPAYGFSFAVLIRCQPHFTAFLCQALQFFYYLLFFFRDNITRFKVIVNINAHIVLLQVADMSIAAFNLKIFAEDLFNGFCLCR